MKRKKRKPRQWIRYVAYDKRTGELRTTAAFRSILKMMYRGDRNIKIATAIVTVVPTKKRKVSK